jgi:hypothetical protein
MNILIVPGTTLIAREICNSLATEKGVCLFGAGYDDVEAESFPYRGFDFVGILGSENLISVLEAVVEYREIDQVIFAHDSWIYEFRNLESVGDAKVIKNTATITEICSFKSLTYEFLKNFIPTPIVFHSLKDISIFPVFLKPDRGQGSVGAKRIYNHQELEQFVDLSGCFDRHWVVSELLPGREFTVDCFSNSKGHLLYSSPRERIAMKSGLAVETKLIEHQELSNWARTISQRIQMVGPWFFQAKEDASGSIRLMEIGLRIAGGSGVQRLKGINLSKLSLWQSQGAKLEIIDQNTFPNNMGNLIDLDFEFQEIYVDYDDTLVINSKLNYELVEFLKLSISRSVNVSLITRHSGNLALSLAQFEVSNLFRKIIHITNNEPKSKYVESDGNFLFIDDSFIERHEISKCFLEKVLVLDETCMLR